jgi:YVTN family beta-propeller protein
VGSEPTAIAITPNNTELYVANWVDGTVTVLSTADLTVTKTIDLNAVLAGTGLLGPTVTSATARPALAHPRSLAITNDGDADDTDEKIYATEFFAQRTEPEASPNASNADFNWEGLLYAIKASDGTVGTVPLSALTNTGFKDVNAADTGCFPNQLQSVTVEGTRAYVTSICASPRGPTNVFQKKACTGNAQCTDAGATCDLAVGACTLACTTDADCGFGAPGACTASGACKAAPQNVKTLTHPMVHVIDTSTDTEVRKDNLNLVLQTAYDEDAAPDDNSGARRMPLVANDIAIRPGTTEAYLSANGADAAFRLLYAGSAVTGGASAGKRFVDLGAAAVPEALRGASPIGIAVAHAHAFAFTLNDVSQNVSAIDLDLGKQAVAGSDKDDSRVAQSSDLPTDPAALAKIRGKGFFNSGLDRWSLKGQAWGACQVCHFEGLSDNITWYFARGPRQSNSLDGSFASGDPTDQRIFNWTGVFDEVHDFENVTRGLLGGVGALVSVENTPPTNADRINLGSSAALPPAGAVNLNGSAEAVGATSAVKSWDDIRAWITTVRAPRAPSNLVAADVAAGKALFETAKCQGCHGGAKWTLSKRFYTPSGDTSAALLAKTWDGAALAAAGFPVALLPAAANQLMRGPMPVAPATTPPGSLDQILCVMRPVGTFAVSPADVNALELRQDMAGVAQGNEANGKGYNVPSLLGMQLGAPYFHAGNARTLEELASTLFAAHHGALNASFAPTAAEVAQLTAFILSIDEDGVPYVTPATAGADGGTFCAP